MSSKMSRNIGVVIAKCNMIHDYEIKNKSKVINMTGIHKYIVIYKYNAW
jgi:hypothetical protein